MKTKMLELSIITSILIGFIGCGSNTNTKKDSNNSYNQVLQNERQRLIDLGFTPPLEGEENLSTIKKVNDTIDITNPNLDLQSRDINNTLYNNGIHIVRPDITFTQPSIIMPHKLEPFDLLIISDKSLTDILQPLKIHKEEKGIKTEIFSWQTLVDKFNKDGIDNPERIKKAIAYYNKNFSVKYVMIVGDIDNFPSRFCKHYDNYKWGNSWIPTDLYYADLYKEGGAFDNWDGNNNRIFCEMKSTEANPKNGLINMDNIDGYADIALGRVPADTAEEVQNYINKVIQYENSPMKEWNKKALMIVPGVLGTSTKEEQNNDIYFVLKDAYNDNDSTKLKKEVSKILTKANISSIKLFHGRYPNPNDETFYPMTKNIIKYINDGVGIVNFAGHGAYWGWDMGTKISGENRIPFINQDINNLSNIDKLPIVVSIACDTGKYYFDKKFVDINNNEFNVKKDCTTIKNETYCQPSPYSTNNIFFPQPKDIQPSKYNIDSMAENFLVNRDKTGAIAFIASTEAAQGGFNSENNLVGSFAVDKEFFNAYVLKLAFRNLIGGDVKLGDVWKLTNYNYVRGYVDMNIKESIDWHNSIPLGHLLKYHLFGDPSLILKNTI